MFAPFLRRNYADGHSSQNREDWVDGPLRQQSVRFVLPNEAESVSYSPSLQYLLFCRGGPASTAVPHKTEKTDWVDGPLRHRYVRVVLPYVAESSRCYQSPRYLLFCQGVPTSAVAPRKTTKEYVDGLSLCEPVRSALPDEAEYLRYYQSPRCLLFCRGGPASTAVPHKTEKTDWVDGP